MFVNLMMVRFLVVYFCFFLINERRFVIVIVFVGFGVVEMVVVLLLWCVMGVVKVGWIWVNVVVRVIDRIRMLSVFRVFMGCE